MRQRQPYDTESRDALAIVRLRETIRSLETDRIVLLIITGLQAAALAAVAYLNFR